MQLRNKKTGKIAEAIDLVDACEIWGTAKTPSEIFEDWEFCVVVDDIHEASKEIRDILEEE